MERGVRVLVEHGISSGYRRNNFGHWGRFSRFCLLYSYRSIPASEEILCLYGAYRFATSAIKGPSFKNELYGIRSFHVDNNVPLDIRTGVMQKLARVRSAFNRLRPSISDKEPITNSVLNMMLIHLDGGNYDHRTLRALLCFAKYGMLRVSEYTYGKNGNRPLVGSISFWPNAEDAQYLLYVFDKSKTNQYSRKERIICVCNCPEACAVHEVAEMLAMRPVVRASDPLFWLSDGSSPSASGVNALISNLCMLSGLDESKFRSHQLKSGGVVDYLAAGVPDSIIMEMTRWKNLASMVPYRKLSHLQLASIVEMHLR